MSTFSTVSTGATILASDLNQFANSLNGTTNGPVIIANTSGGSVPLVTQLATAPGADGGFVGGQIPGDTNNRIALYIRGSDGYGGLYGSVGGASLLKLYAQSGAWKTDNNFIVVGTLTTDGGTISTNGSGAFNGVSMTLSAALTARQISASYASGNFYDGSGQFGGTGSGTYTHGLSIAPTFVGVTQKVAGSTTTVGSDTYGSTTVHVNVNGSFLFTAWAVLN